MRYSGTNTLFNTLRAGTLACIYLAYWSVFVAHPFTAPEHDHEHEPKICRAAEGETHLHGAEYIHQDCSICQIAPTAIDLPPVYATGEAILLQPTVSLEWPPAFALHSFHYTASQPRAPPVRLPARLLA